MSLSLKWRPQKFSDLEGQAPVRQILTNALQSPSIHPALIFSGPKGTGKTSCARILAKALICEDKQNSEPCCQCHLCSSVQEGHDMDVIEIDGASNNGVDAIRDLKDSVQYMPHSGKYRIYIIDEVHMLSQSAFNSLLKTLEEPPSHVVFIMATTELRKIPATVLSRCQLLHFRPISGELIQKNLKKICTAENIKIEDSALWLIAEQAQGSMRDSLVLLDQMSCLGNKKISSEMIEQSLGLTQRSILNSLLKSLIEKKTQEILSLIRTLDSIDPHTLLNNLLVQIRNLVMLKLTEDQNSSLVFLIPEEKKLLKDLAQTINIEDAHLLFDMCLKGREDLSRSFSAQITLEMVLIRMSQYPNIEPLLSRNRQDPQQAPVDSKKNKASESSKPSVATFNQPVQKKLKTSGENPKPPSQKDKASSVDNQLKKTPQQNTPSTTPLSSVSTVESGDRNSPSPQKHIPSTKPLSHSPNFSRCLSDDGPQKQWSNFLRFIQEKDPRTAAEVGSFSLHQLNEKELTLSYPKSLLLLKEKTKNTKFLNSLNQHLMKFFDKKLHCKFISTEEKSIYAQKSKRAEELYKKKMDKAQKHHIAQKITNLFQAQIIENKPSHFTKDI